MKHLIVLLTGIVLLSSCKRSFEPIDYGKEACAHCRMTIVDHRYAAEMVDKNGKIFKFDDVICMKHFMKENGMTDNGKLLFVADYSQDSFLDARKAIYIHDAYFKSPMHGQCGAFATAAEALPIKDSLHANEQTWNELQ